MKIKSQLLYQLSYRGKSCVRHLARLEGAPDRNGCLFCQTGTEGQEFLGDFIKNAKTALTADDADGADF